MGWNRHTTETCLLLCNHSRKRHRYSRVNGGSTGITVGKTSADGEGKEGRRRRVMETEVNREWTNDGGCLCSLVDMASPHHWDEDRSKSSAILSHVSHEWQNQQTGCITLSFDGTEIPVSRSHWDSYTALDSIQAISDSHAASAVFATSASVPW